MDIFHEWITIDFRDKLSDGNTRVSGGQVDRWKDVVKKDLRKMGISWDEVKRLRRTGGAGGIVSPNESLTQDEPGSRNEVLLSKSKLVICH